MKKAISLILILMMILSMTACGGAEPEEQMITRAAEETVPTAAAEVPAEEAPAETEAAPVAGGKSYIFKSSGAELVAGTAFDPSILPEAESVYEVPSCAIVGTDNLYNYGTFELTAFDDGTGEMIYSILLTDPNITTPEGLALGDSLEKMVEIYGDSYTQEGSTYTYTGDIQVLYIIAQGDNVASIEYRMITE